jgi:hypothetical protein
VLVLWRSDGCDEGFDFCLRIRSLRPLSSLFSACRSLARRPHSDLFGATATHKVLRGPSSCIFPVRGSPKATTIKATPTMINHNICGRKTTMSRMGQ